jgi:hypothetical protein
MTAIDGGALVVEVEQLADLPYFVSVVQLAAPFKPSSSVPSSLDRPCGRAACRVLRRSRRDTSRDTNWRLLDVVDAAEGDDSATPDA